MSQEMYKRRGHNWKQVQKDDALTKSKDSRYQYIMENFRKIDLNGQEDEDQEVVPAMIPNTPRSSVTEEDDWENHTPLVDLRTFNFDLPGILCPFCRDNLMQQDVQTGKLMCSCGGYLECQPPILDIRNLIREIVGRHSVSCPSNLSPDYSIFKTHIVLNCHVCKLSKRVS